MRLALPAGLGVCALSIAVMMFGGETAPTFGGGELPAIPLSRADDLFVAMPLPYLVAAPVFVRPSVSLDSGIVKSEPRVATTTKKRKRTPTPVDVAVLRVLVEHIDTERRLSRGAK